ncbi:MAG: hypothetical protein RL318_1950, partial [Fibrobacterota bacterium]|jgi:hypothetical protein
MIASMVMMPVLTIISAFVALMGALGMSLMFKEMEPGRGSATCRSKATNQPRARITKARTSATAA